MLKRVLALLGCIMILIGCVADCFTAQATDFGISGIAATAASIFQSAGMPFDFVGGDSAGVSNILSGELSDWYTSKGMTQEEIFGQSPEIWLNEGYIFVGVAAYSAFMEFADYIIDKYSLDEGEKVVSEGTIDDIVIGDRNTDFNISAYGFSVQCINRRYQSIEFKPYYNGAELPNGAGGAVYSYTTAEFSNPGWIIENIRDDIYRCTYTFHVHHYQVGDWDQQMQGTQFTLGEIPSNRLTMDGTSYFPLTVDTSEAWRGEIPGLDQAQDIDAAAEIIIDDVAAGELEAIGTVVEIGPIPPQPTTTPVPTYPPAADVLTGVNTVINQGNDTLQDLNDINILTGGVLEGINDLIGIDEGVAENVSDIAGTAEEVLEGIDNIGTDVGGIATDVDGIATDVGGIATDVGGIATDVGDIAGELEGVGEGVSNIADTVGDIADALQPTEIQTQRIDLRTLFPFCIPFDIYNLLRKFDATPKAPHVQIPFVIQSIGFSYTIDLDFSSFNTLAQAVRTVELIVYALGLAWATSKVIKW